MTLTRWTLLGFTLAVASLGAVRWAASSGPATTDPLRPDAGELPATLSSGSQWVEVARFSTPPGEIVDVAADSASILALTRFGWAISGEGVASPWYGDEEPGSPRAIGRPELGALHSGTVWIADPRNREIQSWTPEGQLLGRRVLPTSGDVASQILALHPTGDEGLLWTLFGLDRAGTAGWVIHRLVGEEVILVDSIALDSPHALFRQPQLLVGPGQGWLRVDAVEMSVARAGEEDVSTAVRRLELPTWRVPRDERAEFEEILSRMPVTTALHSQLPDSWPAVQEIERMVDGRVLVEVSAGAESTHLLLLDPELKPVARLTDGALERPVFLSDGRAFRVTEELNQVVIHELRF